MKGISLESLWSASSSWAQTTDGNVDALLIQSGRMDYGLNGRQTTRFPIALVCCQGDPAFRVQPNDNQFVFHRAVVGGRLLNNNK